MSKATKRKHVVREIKENLSIPTESQSIVRMIASRGNNLHEVSNPAGDSYLVSMPTKYRKNIWVKMGDYVLVEPIAEGDKVKAEIVTILTKEHIKFYRSRNCWPKEFDHDNKQDDNDEEEDLFINTNRRPQNHDTTETESDTSSEVSDSD